MKKGKGKNGRLLPNSLRIISSCIKTVSTNATSAVKSAVSASISLSADDRKEQVLWAGFDKLELGSTTTRRVLLLGYLKGFQVFDVEDASGLSELVSRRDGPVSFLQMLPYLGKRGGSGEDCKMLHPMLAVVGGDVDERIVARNMGQGSVRYGSADSSVGSSLDPPSTVRFYSMKSNEYVKVVDFNSAVFMVRCSRRVVAIGLEEQIYCFDTLTLENRFIVVTFPVPRVREQGAFGISTCYGPMAVGPRWLAYSPSCPIPLNNSRVSPKTYASTVYPATSSASGTVMARYAVVSSKQLATGILSLGKSPAPESENTGLVVVKDILTLDVISHFRAHTSPISALCFDPNGTLLVTASVHGNHINIFQIKPSHRDCKDWSTSYVQLYSLYRGLTTAVIQDISFSYDSAWIAVVSSRGTCHIFILSPTAEQSNSQALSTFKWFASPPPFNVSYQNSHPCTLSAITRIRCSDSGLLNSVSNAAASVVGKAWVPSGAVAAVFHNSSSNNSCSIDVNSSDGSLKHVLVYALSGFVVQHEIQIPIGFELSEGKKESDESRVKVETIQWWDVCRRLDNPEREECISDNISESNDNSRMIVPENVCTVEKKLVKSDSMKSLERSQGYLSNAEVQIRSCSEFIWQNPKIQFRVMECKAESCTGGEFEIETVSSREVEIRRKDLLPVFDHFPRARSGWINRSIPFERRYPNGPDSLQAKENTYEASTIFLSNPPSFSSTESSEGGLSRRIENLFDLDHMNIDRSPLHASHCPNDLNSEREGSTRLKTSTKGVGYVLGTETMHTSSSSGYEFPSEKVENRDSASCQPSDSEKNTVYFAEFLKEGYYDNRDFQVHPKPTEVVTDEVGKGGNLKEEEPLDEEGWIGGMFDFSE